MNWIPLDEVYYFDVTTHNPSTGAVANVDSGTTGTFSVFEESNNTPIINTQALVTRSLTGQYYGTFTISAATGFEVGRYYSVVTSATVNSIAGKSIASHFWCIPAVAQAGMPRVDIGAISGDATAADNAESFFDGDGYAGTGNIIPTVTNVTNLHASAATVANQTTILNRLGSWTGSARNTILGALQALFRSDSDATVPSDINADLGGGAGTADNTTDSLQASQAEHDTTQSAVVALNNLSAAQVNAEVVDALNVDTYAEPGQATPGATTTLVQKIGYLYKAWRNRSTLDFSGGGYRLYNDDATTIGQTATVADDNTTFDRGEVGTGS